MTTPTFQPGSMIMAALPSPSGTAGSLSFSLPLTGALEYFCTTSLSQLSPAWDSAESSVPFQASPSLTATSPPSSQTNGSAAYQYCPGK